MTNETIVNNCSICNKQVMINFGTESEPICKDCHDYMINKPECGIIK